MTQELPRWVPIEGAKPRRKPGPKPKPKIHVKINLTGEVEFDLEGDQAAELIALLRGIKFDEVLNFLDPWASGVELTNEVGVTGVADRWLVDEATETIQLMMPDPWRFG